MSCPGYRGVLSCWDCCRRRFWSARHVRTSLQPCSCFCSRCPHSLLRLYPGCSCRRASSEGRSWVAHVSLTDRVMTCCTHKLCWGRGSQVKPMRGSAARQTAPSCSAGARCFCKKSRRARASISRPSASRMATADAAETHFESCVNPAEAVCMHYRPAAACWGMTGQVVRLIGVAKWRKPLSWALGARTYAGQLNQDLDHKRGPVASVKVVAGGHQQKGDGLHALQLHLGPPPHLVKQQVPCMGNNSVDAMFKLLLSNLQCHMDSRTQAAHQA